MENYIFGFQLFHPPLIKHAHRIVDCDSSLLRIRIMMNTVHRDFEMFCDYSLLCCFKETVSIFVRTFLPNSC